MKYSCKQKHFWWFLSLSTPCMSHFHFYTLVLTPIPRILPWFRVFPALFSKFWHWFPPFPRFLPWFLAFLPLFPVFSPWFSAFPQPIPHPPPPIPFTRIPNPTLQLLQVNSENNISTNWKTLSTICRNSHQNVLLEVSFKRTKPNKNKKLQKTTLFLRIADLKR